MVLFHNLLSNKLWVWVKLSSECHGQLALTLSLNTNNNNNKKLEELRCPSCIYTFSSVEAQLSC